MAARAAAPSMGAAVFIGAEPALDDEVEAPAAAAEEEPEPLLEEDSEPEEVADEVLVSVLVAVLLPDSELLPDALVTEPAPVL